VVRELNARQRAAAANFWPDASNWYDAFTGFAKAVAQQNNPIKRARMLRTAGERLKQAQRGGACYFHASSFKSRSAFIHVLTFETGPHPMIAVKDEGIIAQASTLMTTRKGLVRRDIASSVAFVSWHALGRMPMRSDVDISGACGIGRVCGIVGLLLRHSSRHYSSEINVVFGDLLCKGTFRFVPTAAGNYGFFDVITALTLDQVEDPRQVEQGRAISAATIKYITGDILEPDGLFDDVAVLPFRETDYVSREIQKAFPPFKELRQCPIN
jgi:hypothetical protein